VGLAKIDWGGGGRGVFHQAQSLRKLEGESYEVEWEVSRKNVEGCGIAEKAWRNAASNPIGGGSLMGMGEQLCMRKVYVSFAVTSYSSRRARGGVST